MPSGAGSSRHAGCLPGRMSQSSQHFHTTSPPTVFSFKSTVLPDASHPTPQLWGSSASWLTVSMWQSSLKWKRSRKLGVCASFTRLGFQLSLSVCQRLRLWTKAFETMPDSAASDHRASSLFWLIRGWFEVVMNSSSLWWPEEKNVPTGMSNRTFRADDTYTFTDSMIRLWWAGSPLWAKVTCSWPWFYQRPTLILTSGTFVTNLAFFQFAHILGMVQWKSETWSQKSVMRKTPPVPTKLFDWWMVSRERPAVTDD